MQITSVSLAATALLAGTAAAYTLNLSQSLHHIGTISAVRGDCSERATDANGNGGCTIYEDDGGTQLVIDAHTTFATGTVAETMGDTEFATTITGGGAIKGTDVAIVDGTTIVNGQTVGVASSAATAGAAASSTKNGNAAPAVTKAPAYEMALAAIAAGGLAAAF